MSERTWEARRVRVDPEQRSWSDRTPYRGRGVGRALLNAAVEALTMPQAPRVMLSTAERNTSAQGFFERMGFRSTMVEMTKELE